MTTSETELVSKYLGWALREIQELPIRVRRFWAETAAYRLKKD